MIAEIRRQLPPILGETGNRRSKFLSLEELCEDSYAPFWGYGLIEGREITFPTLQMFAEGSYIKTLPKREGSTDMCVLILVKCDGRDTWFDLTTLTRQAKRKDGLIVNIDQFREDMLTMQTYMERVLFLAGKTLVGKSRISGFTIEREGRLIEADFITIEIKDKSQIRPLCYKYKNKEYYFMCEKFHFKNHTLESMHILNDSRLTKFLPQDITENGLLNLKNKVLLLLKTIFVHGTIDESFTSYVEKIVCEIWPDGFVSPNYKSAWKILLQNLYNEKFGEYENDTKRIALCHKTEIARRNYEIQHNLHLIDLNYRDRLNSLWGALNKEVQCSLINKYENNKILRYYLVTYGLDGIVLYE